MCLANAQRVVLFKSHTVNAEGIINIVLTNVNLNECTVPMSTLYLHSFNSTFVQRYSCPNKFYSYLNILTGKLYCGVLSYYI